MKVMSSDILENKDSPYSRQRTFISKIDRVTSTNILWTNNM